MIQTSENFALLLTNTIKLAETKSEFLLKKKKTNLPPNTAIAKIKKKLMETKMQVFTSLQQFF